MVRERWARDLGLERRWRGLVAAQRRAGVSIRAFCRARNVSEASFHYWRRELDRRDARSESATPAFVPVTVLPSAAIEVVLPSGVMVRVPAGADDAAAARLISALSPMREAASC